MATIDENVQFQSKRQNGDVVLQFPVTKAENVLGLEAKLSELSDTLSAKIYAAQPDSPKQLAEDGTIFYVDCADLGEGKPVSEVYTQENPVVKDLCGNFEDTTIADLSSGFINNSSLNLVRGKQELKVPPNLFIFFGADNSSGDAYFSLDWEYDSSIGVFISNQGLNIYATATDGTDSELFIYHTTAIPTSGFHHYAVVVTWVGLSEGESEAVKIYVDGKPLTSNFNLLGTMSDGKLIINLKDASDVSLLNITYVKVVGVSRGSVGYDYWGANFNDNYTIDSITFDDTKLIEYQKKKMAHSDYTKYYTVADALKKLISSLNYDLEVGGSLSTSLDGLVWTNGDNITPANNASTTLSNVKITKATIEGAEIKSSNISESEIDSTTTIQDRTYDGGTYDGGSF